MEALVFDLDGTLLDTLADIAGSCNVVLSKHGYPQHPVEAYARMVGNGFEKLLERALPADRMPSPCAIKELVSETRGFYAEHMMLKTQPYPGMKKALASLRQTGVALAVLSNKPDTLTVELIRHYFPETDFAHIQGGLPGVPLKPDPASLLDILNKMHIALDRAGYVGDSDVDMQTAANAGVRGIGAGWGFRGSRELSDAGAAVVLASPDELTALRLP